MAKKDKNVMFEVEDGELEITVNKAFTSLTNMEDVYREFHEQMVSRLDRTFELAGAKGSVETGGYDPFREIKWEPMKAQRERKSDGEVIPAWGGVFRADGKGKVKGRLRPSGKRVQKDSSLNQDTGRYRQRISTGIVVISQNGLTFGPNLDYADDIEALRPNLIITESDARLFEKILLNHVLGEKGGDNE